MPTSHEALPPLRLNGPVYGILLALVTLAATILVAHHPVAHMHDPASALSNLAAIGSRSSLVHGALIALTLLWCVGMSGFAWRLGIEHPAVMAGWLAYVCGSVFLILAGLVDGFVVPDIAAKFSLDPTAHPAALDLIAVCWELLQASTRLGLVLIAFGSVMWGHALMHHRGIARLIALLAMATGGMSAVYLMTKTGAIDVPTLFWYLVAQVIWNLTVAVWMIRGPKRPVTSPA